MDVYFICANERLNHQIYHRLRWLVVGGSGMCFNRVATAFEATSAWMDECLHIDQNLDRSMDWQFYLMSMFMSHPFGHSFNGLHVSNTQNSDKNHCPLSSCYFDCLFMPFCLVFLFRSMLSYTRNSCWNFNSSKTNVSSSGCVPEARALACNI